MVFLNQLSWYFWLLFRRKKRFCVYLVLPTRCVKSSNGIVSLWLFILAAVCNVFKPSTLVYNIVLNRYGMSMPDNLLPLTGGDISFLSSCQFLEIINAEKFKNNFVKSSLIKGFQAWHKRLQYQITCSSAWLLPSRSGYCNISYFLQIQRAPSHHSLLSDILCVVRLHTILEGEVISKFYLYAHPTEKSLSAKQVVSMK